MNVRLYRRCAFEVRRDAVTQLSNGRMIYDMLPSRWGMQAYEGGVEYRPREEVFSPESLASLAGLPGVLLHPETNFGTNFGDGLWPVRGHTGDTVVEHTDGIHTAGQLWVYDDEWNAAIADGTIGDLSVGFSVDPNEESGTAPDDAPGGDEHGLEHVSTQRGIIGDHCAGVPEGNAGTAVVVLDAKIPRITRRALADLAACRMDARPYVHDLGSWPRRKTTHQDQITMLTKQAQFFTAVAKLDRRDSKAIQDAWVDIYGESDDPGMKAALAALGGVSAEPAAAAPAPAPAAPVADEEHEEEEETTPPTETEEEEDGESKMDAKALARFDAAVDTRADAIFRAKSVFGVGYSTRLDDGARKPTAAIQLEVVGKMDARKLEQLKSLPAAHQAVGLALAYADAAQTIDDKPGAELKLLETIAATRGDSQSHSDAEKALVARADALVQAQADAETNVHGASA